MPPSAPAPRAFPWSLVWIPLAVSLAALALLTLLVRLRNLHRRNEQLSRARERTEYDLRLLAHATSSSSNAPAAPAALRRTGPAADPPSTALQVLHEVLPPACNRLQQDVRQDVAAAAPPPHDTVSAVAHGEPAPSEATCHGERASSASHASDPDDELTAAVSVSSSSLPIPPASRGVTPLGMAMASPSLQPSVPHATTRRPVKIIATLGEAALLPGGFTPREAAFPGPRGGGDSEHGSCRTDQTPYGCVRLPGASASSAASSVVNVEAARGGRGCVPFASHAGPATE